MSPLAKSQRHDEPLSWRRWWDDTIPPKQPGFIVVRCSQGHPSQLVHIVTATGELVAPPGCASSCHCGKCNENLPLKLEGWTPDAPMNCPRCTTGNDVSDGTCWRCGAILGGAAPLSALGDPRNQTVAAHKPGSAVKLPDGTEFVAQADGSWARLKSVAERETEARLAALKAMLREAEGQ